MIRPKSIAPTRRALFCALILLASTQAWAGPADMLGTFKTVRAVEHGVVIEAENATISLTLYAPDIVRVRVARNGFGSDRSHAVVLEAAGTFSSVTEETGQLLLSTPALTVTVSKSPVRFRFATPDDRVLNEDDADLGIAWQGTEVSCYKKLFPDEKFIGLGEKVGPLDRRGRRFVNWNTDHYAYGVEDDPLYTSVPFFIGLHDKLVYGIFLDNTFRTTFDFGASTDNRVASFSASDGEMNYYFLAGSSVAGVIERYTFLTGRPPMPPLWSLGYQQCRWSYYPDAEVLNLARTFRQKRIPADMIYLDIHYMDQYKIFTWHPERFPDPKRMIDTLRSLGFHVATIVDPGIKVEKGYFAYDEGIRNDFFAKYPNGSPYIGSVWPGRCHFPDFTRSEVRDWWGSSFARLVTPGVEGFWNDMNEPAVWGQSIPGLVQLGAEGSLTTMSESHNIYGLEMARATFEGTRKLLQGRRPFVLTRAGFAGVQRYSAVWTGDNVPSDDHMLLAVRLVNAMGLSGIAFTGPDIAGFSGNATPALFTRWLSIGTYTPFFRNHKQYGMNRQEPWSFGEEVEASARKSIEQRYRLLPYIYSAFYETSRTGLPVQRSLAIEYPNDEHVFWSQYQNEYLFGDHLLVAPVASTEQYAGVYLPAGDWYRLSNDRLYRGGAEAVVDAPLNDLPVFVRAGAILPMQSAVQFTDELPSDTLRIHLYRGGRKTSFIYYEDDGQTYENEQGRFYKRLLSLDSEKREFTLDRPEGSYRTKYGAIVLVLHGFPEPHTVLVNGRRDAVSGNLIPFPNGWREITVRWQ